MTPETCRAFARYNRWMNAKVFAAAMSLAAAIREAGAGAWIAAFGERYLNFGKLGLEP